MNTSLLKYIGARDCVVTVVASAAEKKLSKVERTLLTCALTDDWSRLRAASSRATERFFEVLETPETKTLDTLSSSGTTASHQRLKELRDIATGPEWEDSPGL